MKIPFTKFGLPQLLIYPLSIIAVMGLVWWLTAGANILPLPAAVIIEFLFACLLIFSLMFFRDPTRSGPKDDNILLAPADGHITDVEIVQENDYVEGPMMRIGIFLSIFDVHINRAPCKAKVEKITYKPGKFLNAMNPKSGKVNESNDLVLVRENQPKDKLVVRQISGAIARRIVCAVTVGDKLQTGEKFGMIKFGSRTELYVPAGDNIKCLVKPGDRVRAGLTVLARYE